MQFERSDLHDDLFYLLRLRQTAISEQNIRCNIMFRMQRSNRKIKHYRAQLPLETPNYKIFSSGLCKEEKYNG